MHRVQRCDRIVLTSWLVPELYFAFRKCCCPVTGRGAACSALSPLAAILTRLQMCVMLPPALYTPVRATTSWVMLSPGRASQGLGLSGLHLLELQLLPFTHLANSLGCRPICMMTAPVGTDSGAGALKPQNHSSRSVLGAHCS